MMALKSRLQHLAERINALELRERALIFLAMALVVVTLLYMLLINPVLTHQKQIAQQITETQAGTDVLHAQIQAQSKAAHVDPNAPLRARLEQLQAESDTINKNLLDIQHGLVTPQQIPMLLKDILRKNSSLQLVSMKTLPAQRLTETLNDTGTEHEKSDAVLATGAYKHGFEITLKGEYLDMLRYLATIEASPWRVFWGDVELNANTYPRQTLTLRLYTLSLDQAWLAL